MLIGAWRQIRCDFRCINALSEFSVTSEQTPELAKESYNCIHFGAAVAECPSAFVDSLAPGGRMLIPLGAPDEEQVRNV